MNRNHIICFNLIDFKCWTIFQYIFLGHNLQPIMLIGRIRIKYYISMMYPNMQSDFIIVLLVLKTFVRMKLYPLILSALRQSSATLRDYNFRVPCDKFEHRLTQSCVVHNKCQNIPFVQFGITKFKHEEAYHFLGTETPRMWCKTIWSSAVYIFRRFFSAPKIYIPTDIQYLG